MFLKKMKLKIFHDLVAQVAFELMFQSRTTLNHVCTLYMFITLTGISNLEINKILTKCYVYSQPQN